MIILEPILAERERWPLWLPVLFGLGAASYFACAVEPWLPALITAVFSVILAVRVARSLPGPFILLLSLLMLLGGFTAAELRAHLVAAPVLERPLDMALVSGLVQDVEPLEKDAVRVVLGDVAVENRDLAPLPQRIRLRLPANAPEIRPGMRIRLYASLMPPSGPVVPGGFDFARTAWFQRLGAVGYGMGRVEIVGERTGTGFETWIAGIRLSITRTILSELPGDTGAVAAALVTGGERAISKPLLDAYRDSGLAHLLSVSGLHMTLVAGLVFVGLRALLALVGPVALRFPIKKWTAFGAALAALFYLFLSGAFVPTQRSFLMTGIVLLGVVLDRQAISMRLVAWAALFILLTQPESILGASFQMSFAAVLALVAVYEIVQGPASAWRRQGGWWRGPVLYVAMLILSSLVAGLATAPFSVDSFNRFNPYGVASNMLAVPLSGVLVMPAALVSVILIPFGLAHYPLIVFGWGCDIVNAIAYEVASWPGAGLTLPSFSKAGFAALVLGGLWLLLMRGSLRWLGILGLAFALSTPFSARLPDLLADGGNGLVALRLDDGRLLITPGKKEPITREAWKRRMATDGEPLPLEDQAGGGLLHCDRLACRAEVNGVQLSFLKRPEALIEDCDKTKLLIADFALLRDECREAVKIDRWARLKGGAHAIWLADGRIERIETVKGHAGPHPWENAEHPRRIKSVAKEGGEDTVPATPGGSDPGKEGSEELP